MSKKRAAVKFGAAGALTSLYGLVLVRKWLGKVDEQQPVSKEAMAIVIGVIGTLTWVAALA